MALPWKLDFHNFQHNFQLSRIIINVICISCTHFCVILIILGNSNWTTTDWYSTDMMATWHFPTSMHWLLDESITLDETLFHVLLVLSWYITNATWNDEASRKALNHTDGYFLSGLHRRFTLYIHKLPCLYRNSFGFLPFPSAVKFLLLLRMYFILLLPKLK